jgi:hypothetical protein
MVIDPKGRRHVQQFRQRHSPDRSQSPGLASLERHAARWAQQPEQEEREEEPMLEAVGETENETEPLPNVTKRDPRRKAEEIDLKVAIALWNSGWNSRAKLARALDIAENQAGKLMAMMHEADGRMDG